MRRITPRTLGGIALLATLLGISVASVWADGPASPELRVEVTTHNPDPNNGGFDSVLLVSVPHQRPFNPPRFNLLQSFVLQSIDLTQTGPDGTSTTSNLITCTLSGPAYPSRNTVSTCTGIFASRVNSRAYPGSNTGIYWSGFSPDTNGSWTFKFAVTGLYNNAPTTLTSSVHLSVGQSPED